MRGHCGGLGGARGGVRTGCRRHVRRYGVGVRLRQVAADDAAQQAVQVLGGQAALGVLDQEPFDHRQQDARAARRVGVFEEDRVERADHRGPVEGVASLHGHVEDEAERPQVGGEARAQPLGALRGQEVRGTDEHAGRGERLRAGLGGDAEVREDDAPALRHQDVRGLHVAVQDAFLLRGDERVEDLEADLGGLDRREGAAVLEDVGERVGVHEFHDDPRDAAVLDDVVDGDDVLVCDAGRRAGLAEGALLLDLAFLVVEVAGQAQLLDRDVAVQHLVDRVPDGAHAAASEDARQPVASRDEPCPAAGRGTSGRRPVRHALVLPADPVPGLPSRRTGAVSFAPSA